jgi:hypothetical protein
VLLLDYTLYVWHVMTRWVPLLWRLHRVHHADLDLDNTTALRFHFGEFALGVPYRALQVCLIGATPRTLTLWQKLTGLAVLLHRSNLRIPVRWERRLVRWLVTPRMHGIHHLIAPDEMNPNWSERAVGVAPAARHAAAEHPAGRGGHRRRRPSETCRANPAAAARNAIPAATASHAAGRPELSRPSGPADALNP